MELSALAMIVSLAAGIASRLTVPAPVASARIARLSTRTFSSSRSSAFASSVGGLAVWNPSESAISRISAEIR